MWAFVNDKFIPLQQAALPITDLAVQRGYAVFDFLKTINRVPLFIDDHIDRLKKSAGYLGLSVNTDNEWWKEIIATLINKNNIEQPTGIRITVTGGDSQDSYNPVSPNIIIQEHPIKLADTDDNVLKKGLHLFMYEYQRDMPMVKSINYQMAVWLQQQMKEANADDILYKKNNFISELPRSNIFLITDKDEIITPDKNILEGITRKNILQLAAAFGTVVTRPVTVSEIFEAKEIFISSTTKRILPVTTIDNRTIGNGQPGFMTMALRQQLISLENRAANL